MVWVDGSGFSWKEPGLELQLVNQSASGILEWWECAGLLAIVGLGQAPYVAIFNSMV